MRKIRLLSIISVCVFYVSCQKNEIDFGSVPENYYTSIIYTDTVEARMETVITDSFVTSSATSFLLGVYKDPEMGVIKAAPFFQIGIPDKSVDIPERAIFDSARLIVRLNKYYYGDSTKPKTIFVHELDETIAYSYNDQLYNTSSFAVQTFPLGEYNKAIRPLAEDSILIPISSEKGRELLQKLLNKDTEAESEENFLRYFKGIRLSVNDNDSSAVHGLKGDAGAITLRIYYHTNTPLPVDGSIDFPSLANSYAFNRVIADRTGTALYTSGAGIKLIPAAATGNKSYTQNGTGVRLKITFPTLGGLLETNDYRRIQKAELLLKVVPQSYNKSSLMLPPKLYLAQTNGTNTLGGAITDSLGQSTLYASPDIDEIFGLNTSYRFDITAYISQLVGVPDRDDYGVFLLEENPTTALQVNRAIFGSRDNNLVKPELRITLVTIKK
jgi:hypothetical protein